MLLVGVAGELAQALVSSEQESERLRALRRMRTRAPNWVAYGRSLVCSKLVAPLRRYQRVRWRFCFYQ